MQAVRANLLLDDLKHLPWTQQEAHGKLLLLLLMLLGHERPDLRTLQVPLDAMIPLKHLGSRLRIAIANCWCLLFHVEHRWTTN